MLLSLVYPKQNTDVEVKIDSPLLLPDETSKQKKIWPQHNITIMIHDLNCSNVSTLSRCHLDYSQAWNMNFSICTIETQHCIKDCSLANGTSKLQPEEGWAIIMWKINKTASVFIESFLIFVTISLLQESSQTQTTWRHKEKHFRTRLKIDL